MHSPPVLASLSNGSNWDLLSTPFLLLHTPMTSVFTWAAPYLLSPSLEAMETFTNSLKPLKPTAVLKAASGMPALTSQASQL